MFADSIILEFAHKRPLLLEELELLDTQEREIVGKLSFSLRRFRLQPQRSNDDTAMFSYHNDNRTRKYIEFRFCVSSDRSYRKVHCAAGMCFGDEQESVIDLTDTLDIFSICYHPSYLRQFASDTHDEVDLLLQFKRKDSFTRVVSICNKVRGILENIAANPYQGPLGNIFFSGQIHSLLLNGLVCLVNSKEEDSQSSHFMPYKGDREKMIPARQILHQHIGDPITIKELSRKIGTNECYLKKGFKEMFGTTIFDYYQQIRMDHATILLKQKGLTVTEVSMLLGYSSISHFSTAFKRHTGIKPCELLFR